MGTSFVEINDKGFWMSDGILTVWLQLLAMNLEEPSKDSPEIKEIRDNWIRTSWAGFPGCVPAYLDEAVSTEVGKNAVQKAIRHLLRQLAYCPTTLNKDILNLLGGNGGSWVKDLETHRLTEVGNAFLDLIDGKIDSDASDTSYMPGCR